MYPEDIRKVPKIVDPFLGSPEYGLQCIGVYIRVPLFVETAMYFLVHMI